MKNYDPDIAVHIEITLRRLRDLRLAQCRAFKRSVHCRSRPMLTDRQGHSLPQERQDGYYAADYVFWQKRQGRFELVIDSRMGIETFADDASHVRQQFIEFRGPLPAGATIRRPPKKANSHD